MTAEVLDMAPKQPHDGVACACPWSWHVVQTEPWREFQALRAVSSLPDLRAYLPIEVYRRQVTLHGRPVYDGHTRRTEEAHRAFFPGYLLVSFDPNGTAWGPLLRRNPDLRTLKLFADGYKPMTLPSAVVEGLQARGRPGDGAIDLEQRSPVLRQLAAGDKVTVRRGPFEGMNAIVDRSSATRVAVMLGMLRVTLDRADVA